jgi:hypothetical protein
MAISFMDRVKKYNDEKATTVAVNPPEAAKVLETQSAPEVATARPAASPDVPAASATATSGQEPTKRTRRTKAEMEAARSADGAAAPAATQATPEPAVSGPSGSTSDELNLSTEALVAELRNRGYAVTLVAAG